MQKVPTVHSRRHVPETKLLPAKKLYQQQDFRESLLIEKNQQQAKDQVKRF
jgi:hypothetical protein